MKNNGKIPTDKYIEKTLKLAQEKANDYVEKFKNQSLNSQQLITILSNENLQFKNEYEKQEKQSQGIQNLNILNWNQNNHLINKNSVLKSTSNDIAALKNYVYNLKIAKTTFVTISASAAIAAAAFWAAAWWFGISVPWAIGSTVASAISGGIAAGISIALVKYDTELSKWNKMGSSFTSIFKLGHIFYAVLNPLLIGSAASATATSWAFPAILSIIPLISATLTWINLYS